MIKFYDCDTLKDCTDVTYDGHNQITFKLEVDTEDEGCSVIDAIYRYFKHSRTLEEVQNLFISADAK